ncbi:MAG: hypothetical protein QM759_15710 [Terricaulis sp.]
MLLYFQAWSSRNVRKAVRRGDIAEAERWLKLVEKAQMIEQRKQRMAYEDRRPVYPRFVGR